MKITAIILLMLGLALRYFVNRRRFNRRTVTGMELFNSYESAWMIKLLEKLTFWIGTFLILGGLLVMIVNW